VPSLGAAGGATAGSVPALAPSAASCGSLGGNSESRTKAPPSGALVGGKHTQGPGLSRLPALRTGGTSDGNPAFWFHGPAPFTGGLAALTAHGGPESGPVGSYLVDSASSHMLVSKIKPCMSKYKQLYSETANGSLNQLSFI
jgi:hypothetical protein